MLRLIEGPVSVCKCHQCGKEGLGGSQAFVSASLGTVQRPEMWYRSGSRVVCSPCASLGVPRDFEDRTRSASVFYADTEGSRIHQNHLGA